MHVHRLYAENFRTFGTVSDGKSLNLILNPTLNLLVGENDAGKTSIVDILRYVLLTTSNEYIRIEDDDFHISGLVQAEELTLEVELRGLTEIQQAALLEWLTLDKGVAPYLVINLRAKRRTANATNGRFSQPSVRVCSGKGGEGPELTTSARELLRSTYLKPLRDAVAELRPKRGSRLSQVLRAQKDVKKEAVNKFDKADADFKPSTLVEIMAQAQHRIGTSPVIQTVKNELNNDYLKDLSFETERLSSDIRVTPELSLVQILEKLELTLSSPSSVDVSMPCERGLGNNNVLFMATELLLLGSGDELALLLIEEPEAHLHPQLQSRVLKTFLHKAAQTGVQLLMTTHSPNIASSAPIENLILVSKGEAFRLARDETLLEPGDYEFLGRFLDASKAGLFFSRALMIVEGPAEELMMPSLARCAGFPFEAYGVSTINVGSVGLFRYARVFQRKAGAQIRINIACVTDRDIVPDTITYIDGRLDKEKKKIPLPKRRRRHPNRKESDFTPAELIENLSSRRAKAEGGNVRVFLSDYWTLEYDLLRSELGEAMFIAIQMARAEGKKGFLSEDNFMKINAAAKTRWQTLSLVTNAEEMAAEAYEPLQDESVSKAITAQYFSRLVDSGDYGKGDEFIEKLPTYLKEAFQHILPIRNI